MESVPYAVAEALARVPSLAHVAPGDCVAQRLAGWTNRTYRVDCPESTVAVRLPGEGAGSRTDRHAEACNAVLAGDLGLGPEVLHADPDAGTMVTRWVEGAALEEALRSGQEGAIKAAARTLRDLHGSRVTFRGHVRLDLELARYVELAGSTGVPWPHGADEALAAVATVVAALAKQPQGLAPCHNDPSPANWRLAAGRAVILDWEYSAPNEPAWDLACLAVEADFEPELDRLLLEAYHGGAPSAADLARHALLRPGLDLLSALWHVAQHAALEADGAGHLEMARRRIERSVAAMRALDPAALAADLSRA